MDESAFVTIFAFCLFLEDREKGIRSSNKWIGLQEEERTTYIEEAYQYLTLPHEDWPVMVLNLLGYAVNTYVEDLMADLQQFAWTEEPEDFDEKDKELISNKEIETIIKGV